jgi:hypothetical protein
MIHRQADFNSSVCRSSLRYLADKAHVKRTVGTDALVAILVCYFSCKVTS